MMKTRHQVELRLTAEESPLMGVNSLTLLLPSYRLCRYLHINADL